MPLRESSRARPARSWLAELRPAAAQAPAPRSACAQSLAREADTTLPRLWQQAGLPRGCALVAVGGYGRGELFPHSDVDVLLLLPDHLAPDARPGELKQQLESFIGSCWDTGLEIGSSVRSVSECVAEAARDVTVQTSLLESRLVTGHRPLYAQFRRASRPRWTRAPSLWPRRWSCASATPSTRTHPTRWSPTARRARRAARPAGHPVGRPGGGLRQAAGTSWRAAAWPHRSRPADQAQRGAAEPDPRPAACAAGRREDRLVFDLQTAVAEIFGFTAQSGAAAAARAPVEPADEALLLGRQGGDAAQPDPAAEHRGALNPEHARAAPDQRALPATERADRGRERRPVRAQAPRHPRDLPAVPDHRGLKGLSARTLRALYNARNADGRGASARPGQPGAVPGDPAAARGHHPRHAPDEPDLGAGPLPVGVPPHRRPDAARPVPRLHGGPAHPDGAAQRAPLLHPRARHEYPFCSQLAAASTSRGCSISPRCSTTSPRAAAATTPSSAGATPCAASAATTASSARTRELVEFLVDNT
jgi:[protein-PII] uridylyltransferase